MLNAVFGNYRLPRCLIIPRDSLFPENQDPQEALGSLHKAAAVRL